MRPEFGCDIHSFAFASVDTATLTLIKSAVREALVRWEPRVQLDDVSVTTDPVRENKLRIEVSYTIRATNFKANLVYPFYLENET
jgi:hypothetical protein